MENLFKKFIDDLDLQIEKEYKEMNLSDVEIQYSKILLYMAQKEFERVLVEGK